jgi:hypothetical protein
MDASFERNNRLISMGITTLIAVLLFIIFLYIKFITPLPPFEESAKGGLEVNFGFDESGMGDNNFTEHITQDQEIKTKTSSQPQNNSSSDMIATDKVSDVVTPPVKHKKVEVVKEETPPQPDQNLLNALNKVHNSSTIGSNSGDGNSDTPGNQGDPGGSLNSNVYSNFGGGSGGVHGKLRGSGRKMIGDVAIYDNSQETGIVAVEILVDKYGKIVKAEPVLMGSTTTSSVLWKKAKNGLINQILFNESAKGEETRGTIYINFTVR